MDLLEEIEYPYTNIEPSSAAIVFLAVFFIIGLFVCLVIRDILKND
jgi:hypothetical protein